MLTLLISKVVSNHSKTSWIQTTRTWSKLETNWKNQNPAWRRHRQIWIRLKKCYKYHMLTYWPQRPSYRRHKSSWKKQKSSLEIKSKFSRALSKIPKSSMRKKIKKSLLILLKLRSSSNVRMLKMNNFRPLELVLSSKRR